MYAAKLSRKEFLDWVGSQKVPPGEVVVEPEVIGDDVILLWEKRPPAKGGAGPAPAVVVAKGRLENFFAFTSTYVSTYFPFSAFYPVCSSDKVHALLTRADQGARFPKTLVAVVIAEAFIQMKGKAGTVGDISLSACSATFSSAALQLAFQGGSLRELGDMSDSWNDCRSILGGGEPLALPALELESFWAFLTTVFAGDREVKRDFYSSSDEPGLRAQFLAGLIRTGEADPNTWRRLSSKLPLAAEALSSMGDSKERRVRVLDDATAELLSDRDADKETRELVAGYLLAMVAGGSLQYLSLVEPFREKLPRAILWYAVFCGLNERTDTMTIGGCLGRRLARDLMRPRSFFNLADFDISADELRVITSSEKPGQGFRSAHTSSVVVEIYPGVVAAFRHAPRRDAGEAARATTERDREIRFLVDRIARLMEGGESNKRQKDLFSDRPPKRYMR